MRDLQPVDVYLSPATLVVVPSTLVSHWQNEIAKHVHSPDRNLRTHVITGNTDIPAAKEMADHWDVVLLSAERFAREADNLFPEPKRCPPGTCPSVSAASSVWNQCLCPRAEVDPSPLMLCRFKRLIVDEGNNMAGKSRMVDMASKLNVENRWIVSGTPTELLIHTGDEDLDSEQGLVVESPEQPLSQMLQSSRIWTKDEKKDLESRLGRIVVNFLKMPPFYDVSMLDYGIDPTASSQKRWSEDIVKPLFPSGPSPPPSDALGDLIRVLQQIMVRNRAADVEADRPLPPLTRHFVPMHLTTIERKTFNVTQGLIAANAILSEREGQDYLFHPANRKYLADIIGNLWLSCFHFASSDRVVHATEAVQRLEKHLHGKPEKASQAHDEIQEALFHLKDAIEDKQWVAERPDVTYTTLGIAPAIHKAWCRVQSDSQLTAAEMSAMQDGMEDVLRTWANRGRFLDPRDPDIEEELMEDLITLGEKRKRIFWEEEEKREKARTRKKPKAGAADKENKSLLVAAASKAASHGPPSADGAVVGKKANTSRRGNKQADGTAMAPLPQLPPRYQLKQSRIVGCASTKLSKILQILSQQDLPTLIFSSLDNSLWEISACLDLLARHDRKLSDAESGATTLSTRFQHRIFTSGVMQSRLDEYVSIFKSGQIDILLIKTDRGGRGLDLHRAKRVIFVEPEVSAALDRQAVKRAWRQGQTGPVDVYYLYAVGTFEEKITRNMMQDAPGTDSPAPQPAAQAPLPAASDGSVAGLLRDPTMRDYVAHPRYIPGPDDQAAIDNARPVFSLPLFGGDPAADMAAQPDESNDTGNGASLDVSDHKTSSPSAGTSSATSSPRTDPAASEGPRKRVKREVDMRKVTEIMYRMVKERQAAEAKAKAEGGIKKEGKVSIKSEPNVPLFLDPNANGAKPPPESSSGSSQKMTQEQTKLKGQTAHVGVTCSEKPDVGRMSGGGTRFGPAQGDKSKPKKPSVRFA